MESQDAGAGQPLPNHDVAAGQHLQHLINTGTIAGGILVERRYTDTVVQDRGQSRGIMMDLPGSAYLYTVASLAMTFVGFCAVVLILRQARQTDVSHLHRIHSHGYIHVALSAVAAAMLPPLLAVCGLSELRVWQWSSAAIAVVLVPYVIYILTVFYKLNHGKIPTYVWINQTITLLVVLLLIANVFGVPNRPSVGPVAIAATWRFAMAIGIFLWTLEELF
jgi:hypothetical protein